MELGEMINAWAILGSFYPIVHGGYLYKRGWKGRQGGFPIL